MNLTKRDKAELALGSLIDSCEILAGLSGGVENASGYDAYFVPETFWYNRVCLHGGDVSALNETIETIASRVQSGELPPLLCWGDWDYEEKEISRILLRAGYVPMVTQKAMYISLEDRKEIPSKVEVEKIQPLEAERWSDMTAKAFAKPPETDGMKLLADLSECDFLVCRGEEEMIGGTLLICKGENAGIHEVSTLPDYRRRGIGAALVNHAFDIAVKKGCKYATLQASELGYPLYLSLGMEEVGCIHNWIMPMEH